MQEVKGNLPPLTPHKESKQIVSSSCQRFDMFINTFNQRVNGESCYVTDKNSEQSRSR